MGPSILFCIGMVAMGHPRESGWPGASARVCASDDAVRQWLREHSPKLLEASPGRDLPMDISYETFRFEIWPRVAGKCRAFERGAKLKLLASDLLAIVTDMSEDARVRGAAVWLLAARVTKKEDYGRPAAALQLLPLDVEETPGLSQSLAPFLQGSDRATRFGSLLVIGAHGDVESAALLVQAIKGPFVPERMAACRAIGRFGIEGLGVEGIGLLRPLIYNRPELVVTPAATNALLLAGTVEFERSGGTTAIDELIRALRYAPHAGEPRDRKDFGSWGEKREYVIGFTQEEILSGARSDAYIRYSAALQLSHLDIHELQHRAFEPMLQALGDAEVAVVDCAFRFLDRVGARGAEWKAGPVLESLLRAPDEMLSARAAWALAGWGERMQEFVPLIIDEMESNIASRRDNFYHLWALGNSGDQRAAEYLTRLKTRVGPMTRPLDEEGNEFNNDKQTLKLIDDGLVRIGQVRELKDSPDADIQDKALTGALGQYRRRYLAPTLLDVLKDESRREAIRIRCAEALRDIEPVAAPVWFKAVLDSQSNVPKPLRAVLELGPPARKAEEEPPEDDGEGGSSK